MESPGWQVDLRAIAEDTLSNDPGILAGYASRLRLFGATPEGKFVLEAFRGLLTFSLEALVRGAPGTEQARLLEAQVKGECQAFQILLQPGLGFSDMLESLATTLREEEAERDSKKQTP